VKTCKRKHEWNEREHLQCPECMNLARKRWRNKHKEQARESARKWYERNGAAYHRAYRLKKKKEKSDAQGTAVDAVAVGGDAVLLPAAVGSSYRSDGGDL
jgi:hypothetical protein